MENELFICGTPYHVTLALAISMHRRRLARSHLALFDHYDGACELVDALQRWQESPFASVDLLLALSSFRRRWLGKFLDPGRVAAIRTLARSRANARRLRKLIDRLKPARVYVNNDYQFLTQMALSKAKIANRSARGVYVEDGAAAYTSAMLGSPSWKQRVIQDAYVWPGRCEPIGVMGTSREIDECRVMFPNSRRTELQRLPCDRIPVEELREPAMQAWLARQLTAAGVTDEVQALTRILVVLPHSAEVKDVRQWKSVLHQIAAIGRTRGWRMAVKYHPRETQPDYLSVKESTTAAILPAGLALEWILLRGHELLFVIGDSSTGLLTSRALSPKAQVIALPELSRYQDSGFLESLRLNDIRILRTDELGVLLCKAVPCNGAQPSQVTDRPAP